MRGRTPAWRTPSKRTGSRRPRQPRQPPRAPWPPLALGQPPTFRQHCQPRYGTARAGSPDPNMPPRRYSAPRPRPRARRSRDSATPPGPTGTWHRHDALVQPSCTEAQSAAQSAQLARQLGFARAMRSEPTASGRALWGSLRALSSASGFGARRWWPGASLVLTGIAEATRFVRAALTA